MLKQLFFVALTFCFIQLIRAEYISQDEPTCREDCFALNETRKKEECINDLLKFYSYKMIKSVFNYGKTAIYAGLWVTRHEHPDLGLFESVLNDTLNEYNEANLLGDLNFEDLKSISYTIFESLQNYTFKQNDKESHFSVPYASIPSLQCPILCSYDIITWQTLFYISLSIFILALITISLYTIFLRKQYLNLKSRLKIIKYTKVTDSNNVE